MVAFQHQLVQKIASVNAAWRIHLIGDFDDVLPALRERFSGGDMRLQSHRSVDVFCQSEQPIGVLLMDLGKVVVTGDDIRDIKERFINRETVYVVDDTCASHALNLIRYGVANFLVRPFGTDVLHQVVENSVKKECLRIVGNEIQSWQEANWKSLTPREQIVCKYLVTGFGNTQIAEMLEIRPDTVKKHRACILEKLHASSLSDLVRAFKCFDFSVGSAMDCVVSAWGESCPVWNDFNVSKNRCHA